MISEKKKENFSGRKGRSSDQIEDAREMNFSARRVLRA